MDFKVTQFGKKVHPSLYTWDKETRTFSSKEQYLHIDFSKMDDCIFKLDSACKVLARDNCTFIAKSRCMFETGSYCSFTTDSMCDFITKDYCTFTTSYECILNTGSNCTITTEDKCIIKTKDSCVIAVKYNCTVTPGSNCIIIRQDEYETIEASKNTRIRTNREGIRGYSEIDIEKEQDLKVVAYFSTLMRLASELDKAKTLAQLLKSKKEHDEYRSMCFEAGTMTI